MILSLWFLGVASGLYGLRPLGLLGKLDGQAVQSFHHLGSLKLLLTLGEEVKKAGALDVALEGAVDQSFGNFKAVLFERIVGGQAHLFCALCRGFAGGVFRLRLVLRGGVFLFWIHFSVHSGRPFTASCCQSQAARSAC